MKKTRESVQVILVIFCFIIFKRTNNLALQLTLYIILNSIIVQEFLHIYNNERNSEKNEENRLNKVLPKWRLAVILFLQFFIILTIYYLSTILLKSFLNYKISR